MFHSQATLCYILKDERLLLIHKKRGVGAGKINAPGGKVDPAETPREAAIRETEEEVGVTPLAPELRGELWFFFSPANIVRCSVFLARDFTGDPRETDEALPLWFDVADLPFDRMWEDDAQWLPLLLAGARFKGTVQIEGDRATHTKVDVISND